MKNLNIDGDTAREYADVLRSVSEGRGSYYAGVLNSLADMLDPSGARAKDKTAA